MAWRKTPNYPKGLPTDTKVNIKYRCGLIVYGVEAGKRQWGWGRPGFKPEDEFDILEAERA